MMKRNRLVIYTNEYSASIAAIFKLKLQEKETAKDMHKFGSIGICLLLLPISPKCNCFQQKAQNSLRARMKRNTSQFAMYFPRMDFHISYSFLCQDLPLALTTSSDHKTCSNLAIFQYNALLELYIAADNRTLH